MPLLGFSRISVTFSVAAALPIDKGVMAAIPLIEPAYRGGGVPLAGPGMRPPVSCLPGAQGSKHLFRGVVVRIRSC